MLETGKGCGVNPMSRLAAVESDMPIIVFGRDVGGLGGGPLFFVVILLI